MGFAAGELGTKVGAVFGVAIAFAVLLGDKICTSLKSCKEELAYWELKRYTLIKVADNKLMTIIPAKINMKIIYWIIC